MEKHYIQQFVLNMVQGHHLQLRSHPPLFCDFRHFNVKVAAAHHPVIQKEVDELLTTGATEPSSSGACFYSIMFVVLLHSIAIDHHTVPQVHWGIPDI